MCITESQGIKIFFLTHLLCQQTRKELLQPDSDRWLFGFFSVPGKFLLTGEK